MKIKKVEEFKQKHRFTNVPEGWQGKSFYLTESELDEYAQGYLASSSTK